MSAVNKSTTKSQRFVEEIVIDSNATQVAIRARYSVKTARAIAHRLLIKADIVEAINEKKKTIANRLEITAERVLLERSRLAFFDPRKLFNADPQ
jgi:phage terminase small subunit